MPQGDSLSKASRRSPRPEPASPSPQAAPPTSDAPAGRPVAARASSGRAGSRNAGSNRPRRPLYQPSFLERHRSALLSGGVLFVIAVVGAIFFFSATAPTYACTNTSQPAPAGTPLPNGSPAPLGQAQPDMGNVHVTVGTNQKYAYCPPASGPHYNALNEGPIAAKYYGPDDGTRPEGWIHNLEHGGIVILYNCKMGACTDATAATLQGLATTFPDSPQCHIKAGSGSPVIARFDDMPAPFAALVWDRLIYLDTLDVTKIKAFYQSEAEVTNPELQCPRATPTPAPSLAPRGSPSQAASPSPI